MNTNINNKKFKLVPLRNQSMQAFACKRECDKEGIGKRRGRRGREEEREDREGLVMWRHLGGGLGGEKKIMTTPRLIRFRFNDTQKPMDVISDFVVIINPHVYFFFSRLLPFHFPWLHIRSLSFAFLPVFVTTVVCRPNHRRKNVTPRTVLLWSMYICIYTCLYIGKRSRSKIHFVFFSFSLSVTSWYTGSAGWKSGNVREKVC